jgi:hypothetical protein
MFNRFHTVRLAPLLANVALVIVVGKQCGAVEGAGLAVIAVVHDRGVDYMRDRVVHVGLETLLSGDAISHPI